MGMESIYRLSVVLDLIDRMSGPAGEAGTAVQRLNKTFSTMQKAGAIMAGTGTAIVGASMGIISSTFSTGDALGELSSLGVKDLQAVEKAAKSFSDTFAGTTKADFISAAYDIKSGIASLNDEGVAQFTDLAALTAKATKSTTGEMTSLFATGYGIYKNYYSDLSDMEFGEVFSAGIATAVKNYKTAGSEMASAIGALGATATNANVPMEEQLAIVGELQATMSGSEAATKYKSFLTQAAGAGEKLGLTFMDSNNMLLTMPELLDTMKGKYGETLDAVEKQQLKEAFGSDEAIQLIDLLYGKIDTLRGGIDTMAESMLQGRGSTQEMAEAIQNTPHQEFIRMQQEIHNTVEEIGNGLLPTFNDALGTIGEWLKKGSEWVTNNKETVSSIASMTMKFGGLLVAGGAAVTTIGTIGKVGIALWNTFKLLKIAFTAVSAAFTASPIGWIVLGVVALVAAFTMLWKRSESFRSFWIGMFEQVKGVFSSAWSSIKPALESLGNAFMELYKALQPVLEVLGVIFGGLLLELLGIIMGVFQGMAQAAAPLINAVSDLLGFVTNVVKMIGALFTGDLDAAFGFAMAALDNLKGFWINIFDGIGNFIDGFVSGFLDTICNAFSALGFDISDKLTAIKASVSEKITAVKDVMANVTSAATETVKQNLANMKSAYEANGGGLKGAAAAAMEGVKGYYTAGFTFLDNLTGGKLTDLKTQWVNGFNNIKAYIAGLPEQFRQSGKKIMDTFTEGIKSAVNKPIEAVKSTLQKVRNMLPFSDAKEGPLSHLTLSGKKVFMTMAEGMEQTKDLPGNVAESGFEKTADKMDEDGVSLADRLSGRKKPNLRKEAYEQAENIFTGTFEGSSEKGQTIIQNLHLTLDLSKLKDLPTLFKIVDELKDSANGKGTPKPA